MTDSRNLKRPLLVGLLIGVIASGCFLVGLLDTWSKGATDRLFLSRAPDPAITVVAIDDASIGQLGRWPWARSVHAELIKDLADAGPKVIGYDVNFPEASDAQDDQQLADALKSAGNVVLPVELSLVGAGGKLAYDPAQVLSPISLIASSAVTTGHSNTPPDADGVMRRVPLTVPSEYGGSPIPSFVAEVSRLAGLSSNLAQAPTDADDNLIVNFPGVPFHTFRVISAADVVQGRADLSSLKNGIVFVGATAADLHDALLTPTSNGVPMPGVEIHASTFDTIAGEHWLSDVPPYVAVAFLLLIGILVALLASRIRARWSLPLLLVLWIGIIVAAFALFDHGYILDIVWPTLVLFFAYGAVTLERRINADRARRELKAAFSRYVSASVVESIIKDPSKLKLGGERKRMSVLFSDIRGFTTISEGLSPEKLVEILNKYLNRMTDLVFTHEGVLDKYIGDAVMAFWNAPFDQPDHALRAVRTALAMRDVLQEMDKAKVFGDIQLKIGIGVNTGDMVVGNVGGDARFDYTVIGDNVNLGSRLESLTKEYHVWVLVTEATRAELQDRVLTRRIDKVAVKGKKEPVMIYEAMELTAKASPELKQLAAESEAALDKYFDRDFAGASAACDAILSSHPDDGPSKTLKERADHFKTNPPPDDWVGTWVYTKK
ncbi:MAG: adenylate/guanylate cyclase domain-containing protein [Patescibacteria group bacterium]